MERLTEALVHARLTKGYKIKEVAALTGIDASLISRIERGGRKPTPAQIPVLSEVYGIDALELRRMIKVAQIMYLLDEEPDLATMIVEDIRVEYLSGLEGLQVPRINEALQEALDHIDALKKKWNACRPLNETQLLKMKAHFNTAYTFESNRIEGNTLSLQETSLVVHEGLTISGKSMKEHLEAVNHAEAVEYVEDLVRQKTDLSSRILKELHHLILKSIAREHAGKYRTVPVRITGSDHIPPDPYLLDKMMEDYFLFYTKEKRRLHPVVLAADMHERLVTIHPFIDGNGRTARLVMNLILLQHGYTIANLKGDIPSRLAYYRALEKVQMDNAPQVFYKLVAQAVEASLQAHLAMV
ncbi:MAG: Fic family protein [Bacteroidia bacterium]